MVRESIQKNLQNFQSTNPNPTKLMASIESTGLCYEIIKPDVYLQEKNVKEQKNNQ